MKEHFGGMSFLAFRGHIVKTCSLPKCLSLCDYLWEQLILSSLNLFCKPNFSNCSNAFVKPFCVHAAQQISIRMHGDWLILNLNLKSLFVHKDVYCDPEGMIEHGLLPILWRKIQSYLMFLGQSVYCLPPWSLVVQCVEHLCACYAESAMNIKPLYGLPEWLQFISATADLKLLRQISTVRLLLKKRHTLVKLSWHIVHWVDKGISVKVSSTHA